MGNTAETLCLGGPPVRKGPSALKASKMMIFHLLGARIKKGVKKNYFQKKTYAAPGRGPNLPTYKRGGQGGPLKN